MYDRRRRDTWFAVGNIMALVANCHRDPKKMRRPFHPADFLPADLRAEVRSHAGLRLTPANLRLLKPLFEKDAR